MSNEFKWKILPKPVGRPRSWHWWWMPSGEITRLLKICKLVIPRLLRLLRLLLFFSFLTVQRCHFALSGSSALTKPGTSSGASTKMRTGSNCVESLAALRSKHPLWTSDDSHSHSQLSSIIHIQSTSLMQMQILYLQNLANTCRLPPFPDLVDLVRYLEYLLRVPVLGLMSSRAARRTSSTSWDAKSTTVNILLGCTALC